jgi:hypothetical protein
MQISLMVLFFLTVFLAIFTPCLACIRNAERAKYLNAREKQRQKYAQAESDAAWILNRRLME